MNSISNAVFSVIVLPVSNEQTPTGSVLPDRFVSGSKSQQAAIVGADLASTIQRGRPLCAVVVPTIVA